MWLLLDSVRGGRFRAPAAPRRGPPTPSEPAGDGRQPRQARDPDHELSAYMYGRQGDAILDRHSQCPPLTPACALLQLCLLEPDLHARVTERLQAQLSTLEEQYAELSNMQHLFEEELHQQAAAGSNIHGLMSSAYNVSTKWAQDMMQMDHQRPPTEEQGIAHMSDIEGSSMDEM